VNRKELKSDKDIEEILSIAVTKPYSSDEESLRSRMFEIGKELGLSEDEVMAAEAHWSENAGIRDQKVKFQQSARASFVSQLFLYLIINGTLAAMSYSIKGHLGWVAYPLVIWGFFLVLSLYKVIASFFPQSAMFESAFQKWSKNQDSNALDVEIEAKIERKIKRGIAKKLENDD